MPKLCDNTSVGIVIRRGDELVIIERRNYPEAFALPAGHVDGDATFAEAAAREASEEVGVVPTELKLMFREDIDNPCKREGGSHHLWEVYEATQWRGELKAGSDAKAYAWASSSRLKALAERTEYFIKKFGIDYANVGALTKAIFGADPAAKATDPEWKKEMGLEPVWYYILKRINVI